MKGNLRFIGYCGADGVLISAMPVVRQEIYYQFRVNKGRKYPRDSFREKERRLRQIRSRMTPFVQWQDGGL